MTSRDRNSGISWVDSPRGVHFARLRSHETCVRVENKRLKLANSRSSSRFPEIAACSRMRDFLSSRPHRSDSIGRPRGEERHGFGVSATWAKLGQRSAWSRASVCRMLSLGKYGLAAEPPGQQRTSASLKRVMKLLRPSEDGRWRLAITKRRHRVTASSSRARYLFSF